MTAKRWDKSVARALQDITVRELGKPAAYQFCLSMVRKHENDPDRPKTIEAFAAYVFDKVYP